MHYYQFNIGDYASHTRHLTLMEDLAYRKLLDEYYLHERPLNSGIASVARLIGMRENEAEVKVILEEFFRLTDDGWINTRADKEIQAYKSKISQASNAGKASAQRRLNACSTDVQPTIKQEPLNIKHKTITPKPPKGAKDGFEEFYAAFPRKEARAAAVKAFDEVTEPVATLLAALDWQRERNEWKKDGGKYIPLPASWLNAERWKDEKPAYQPGDTLAWYETKNGIEKKAASLGMDKYNEAEEQFPAYRARVMSAARDKNTGFGFNLD